MSILEKIRIAGGATHTLPPNVLEKSSSPVHFGILGAAAIAPAALIYPALSNPDVVIYAIAARSIQKAEVFAKKHGIPKVHSTYEDLINDPKIDVVYIPSPNSHHVTQVLACIKAKKHVLCEKPLGANAAECTLILDQLSNYNSINVVEAFHYRTHPAALYFRKLLTSQVPTIPSIKRIVKADIKFMIPFRIFGQDDIRNNLSLAGGCMMDIGCYAINAARKLVFDANPVRVVKAIAKVAAFDPEIDEAMEFQLEFPGGVLADFHVSFVGPAFTSLSHAVNYVGVSVISDAEGTDEVTDLKLSFKNFLAPSVWHSISVKNTKTGETLLREGKTPGDAKMPTYWHQLDKFTKLVKKTATDDDKAALTFLDDSIENMRVIDMVYEKAGLKARVG
ncbi:hypothetical protein HK096_007665, partial [Nowakowskiella sp. JEL0078]